MERFKAGDMVKIKDDIKIGIIYNGVYFGNIVYQWHKLPFKIEKVDEDDTIYSEHCCWIGFDAIELVEREKIKEFTKSDLQVGYVVEITDKERSKTFLMKVENGKQGECLSSKEAWFPIDNLKENMIYKSDFSEYVVAKVYGFATNNSAWKLSTADRKLLWERVEKSPIQIELESLENKQREIADRIAELSKKV